VTVEAADGGEMMAVAPLVAWRLAATATRLGWNRRRGRWLLGGGVKFDKPQLPTAAA